MKATPHCCSDFFLEGAKEPHHSIMPSFGLFCLVPVVTSVIDTNMHHPFSFVCVTAEMSVYHNEQCLTVNLGNYHQVVRSSN